MEIIKNLKMKKVKNFSQILLISIFLISCKTSINKEYPIKNLEEKINDKPASLLREKNNTDNALLNYSISGVFSS